MPRQLAIFFPDGRTEYWLTAMVFSVGDRFDRHTAVSVVTSITAPTVTQKRRRMGTADTQRSRCGSKT